MVFGEIRTVKKIVVSTEAIVTHVSAIHVRYRNRLVDVQVVVQVEYISTVVFVDEKRRGQQRAVFVAVR